MTVDKAKLRAAAIDWAHHPMEITGDDMQALLDEIDQLKVENDGLRTDAERYRWLRDGAGYCDTRDIPGMAPARMDAFIDAAMGKESSND